MLDPQKNRMDYGQQLIPPEGYALDYAVGTTYSLDLQALMVLPVALFYSSLLDASPDELRLDMVDAILRASDKITVYCQKGKIKVPKKYYSLMAHWEKGIEEIEPHSFDSSFHPKVWVVRFVSDKKLPFYRFLVTSRNMTFVHDWDIAFSSEGYVGSEEDEKTKPLCDFMRFLSKSGKRPIPQNFISDLARVSFSAPEGYKLLNIHTLGLSTEKNALYQKALLKRKWDSLAIISPFVDDGTLKAFVGRCNDVTLLSRKDELDSLNRKNIEALGDDKAYQFSKTIEEGEFREDVIDGEKDEPVMQDLHAKIFIGATGGSAYWFLGSANSTAPAMDRNIELMVELKTSDSRRFPWEMVSLLTNPKEKNVVLFEPYDVSARDEKETDKSLERDLRKIIYDLSGLSFHGKLDTVKQESGDLFNLTIECDASSLELKKGFSVRIKPLPDSNRKAVPLLAGKKNSISNFKDYSEMQLSPFLEVEVWCEGSKAAAFLIRMAIDLPASRLDKIFRSIIDSREKFMQYLTFLLSGQEAITLGGMGESLKIDKDRPEGGHATALLDLPVFEKLLLATSRYPERIRSADAMIQRAKQSDESSGAEPVLSKEFMDLWDVFNGYMQKAQV